MDDQTKAQLEIQLAANDAHKAADILREKAKALRSEADSIERLAVAVHEAAKRSVRAVDGSAS